MLFRPILVGLLNPHIPWYQRWRTLFVLQPICLLSYTIPALPYLFSRPFAVEYLPVWPKRSARALVFKSSSAKGTGRKLRPLHIEIHGGAFIGGLAEQTARWCEIYAQDTGAVVVSITYRFAPEHLFPAAIDDVDDTVKWIKENAERKWGADPTLMTIGGTSAGGNLAFAATQQAACHAPSPTAFKGIVTSYAVMEQRISPAQKPVPDSMPKFDPLRCMVPLFDAYGVQSRAAHVDDPRLSPILARRGTLPDRILMMVAGVDILFEEQTAFAQRINSEDERDGHSPWPRVEAVVQPEYFHGWLEGKSYTLLSVYPYCCRLTESLVPDSVVSREEKYRAFTKATTFLQEIYHSHGWRWQTAA